MTSEPKGHALPVDGFEVGCRGDWGTDNGSAIGLSGEEGTGVVGARGVTGVPRDGPEAGVAGDRGGMLGKALNFGSLFDDATLGGVPSKSNVSSTFATPISNTTTCSSG